MLVKFHSSTSGEIMMFADTARQTLAVLLAILESHKQGNAKVMIDAGPA